MPLVKVSSPEVEQLKEVPPFLMKKLMKARRAHRVHVAATLMGQMDATYAPSTLKVSTLADAEAAACAAGTPRGGTRSARIVQCSIRRLPSTTASASLLLPLSLSLVSHHSDGR